MEKLLRALLETTVFNALISFPATAGASDDVKLGYVEHNGERKK